MSVPCSCQVTVTSDDGDYTQEKEFHPCPWHAEQLRALEKRRDELSRDLFATEREIKNIQLAAARAVRPS